MTEYLVFRKIFDKDEKPLGWRITDGPIKAANGKAAIKQALENDGNEAIEGGDYAATPLRSWYTTTIEVETAFKFS